MEELDDIMKKVGNKQADIKELEKNSPSNKTYYSAMDSCQIAMIKTNSDSVKFVAESEGYDFKDKIKGISSEGMQKVQVSIQHLKHFLNIVEQSKKYLSKRENLKSSQYMDLYVANDRPIKLRIKLVQADDDRHNTKENKEVIYWLAPRIEPVD